MALRIGIDQSVSTDEDMEGVHAQPWTTLETPSLPPDIEMGESRSWPPESVSCEFRDPRLWPPVTHPSAPNGHNWNTIAKYRERIKMGMPTEYHLQEEWLWQRKEEREVKKEKDHCEANLKKGMPEDPNLQEEWHRQRWEASHAHLTPAERDKCRQDAHNRVEQRERQKQDTKKRRTQRNREKIHEERMARREAAMRKPGAEHKLVLHRLSDWNPRLLRPGIHHVRFEREFEVNDSHLNALAQANAVFRAQLTHCAGGGKREGNGDNITDKAILNFVAACPNVEIFNFISTFRLTDTGVLGMLNGWRNLHQLNVSGRHYSHGPVTRRVIDALTANAELAKRLKVLAVVYESVERDAFGTLSSLRPELEIVEGNRDAGILTWKGGVVVRTLVTNKGCPIFFEG